MAPRSSTGLLSGSATVSPSSHADIIISIRTYLGVKEVLYCVADFGLEGLGVKLQQAPFPDGHLIVGCLDRRQK